MASVRPTELPAYAPKLLALVSAVVVGSPFQARCTWPMAVVVLRAEARRVTSRRDFANWLKANDLARLSHECVTRKMKPGFVLVFLDLDAADVPVTGFLAFDLARATREFAREIGHVTRVVADGELRRAPRTPAFGSTSPHKEKPHEFRP